MALQTTSATGLLPAPIQAKHEREFGFRFGERGTHTSRTFMFSELQQALETITAGATRDQYATAIVEENVTGKRTLSTRKLTNQRLGELYGLDLGVTLFRVMRRYWESDRDGRAILALLCALSRDPLLRATVPPILALRPGEELGRQSMIDSVRGAVGDRLNDAIIDKVVRNAASTWAQSGHLEGRVRKTRTPVSATPRSAAYALLMGYLLGFRGGRLFRTLWTAVLDSNEEQLIFQAMDAKRLGALNLKHGGGVIEVDFVSILTPDEIRESHGTD